MRVNLIRFYKHFPDEESCYGYLAAINVIMAMFAGNVIISTIAKAESLMLAVLLVPNTTKSLHPQRSLTSVKVLLKTYPTSFRLLILQRGRTVKFPRFRAYPSLAVPTPKFCGSNSKCQSQNSYLVLLDLHSLTVMENSV